MKPTVAPVAILVLLLIYTVLPGCTTHYRVPAAAQSCVEVCGALYQRCFTECAMTTGRPAVIDDVRESLCKKRCDENQEQCIRGCPGVR